MEMSAGVLRVDLEYAEPPRGRDYDHCAMDTGTQLQWEHGIPMLDKPFPNDFGRFPVVGVDDCTEFVGGLNGVENQKCLVVRDDRQTGHSKGRWE
jgi:hypothetical protein